MNPYPLAFQPLLKAKVWGGRRLRRLNKGVDTDIGESWELADMASTSVSGGGGGAARSVISNGEAAGRTLHDVLDVWNDALIEPAKLAPDGGFPLLVKFLDARENLSVQVHPSPRYAAANPDAHLKTECWYVLEAEPGSLIYVGIGDVTPDDLRRHIHDDTVLNDLIAVEARRGDMHLLPSGTVHALGAGVLVAEVQTPSDTTFRLYDWGRTDREIHIDQALDAMLPGRAPSPTRLPPNVECAELCATDFFAVDEIRVIADTHDLDVTCCSVLMMVDGDGVLEAADDSFEPVPMPLGTTLLVPRICGPQAVIRAAHNPTLLHIRI